MGEKSSPNTRETWLSFEIWLSYLPRTTSNLIRQQL